MTDRQNLPIIYRWSSWLVIINCFRLRWSTQSQAWHLQDWRRQRSASWPPSSGSLARGWDGDEISDNMMIKYLIEWCLDNCYVLYLIISPASFNSGWSFDGRKAYINFGDVWHVEGFPPLLTLIFSTPCQLYTYDQTHSMFCKIDPTDQLSSSSSSLGHRGEREFPFSVIPGKNKPQISRGIL